MSHLAYVIRTAGSGHQLCDIIELAGAAATKAQQVEDIVDADAFLALSERLQLVASRSASAALDSTCSGGYIETVTLKLPSTPRPRASAAAWPARFARIGGRPALTVVRPQSVTPVSDPSQCRS